MRLVQGAEIGGGGGGGLQSQLLSENCFFLDASLFINLV